MSEQLEQVAPSTPETKDASEDKKQYWKTNIKYLGILLSIWFLCSFGAGILFKDVLNEVTVGGFKVGFWFAQQGSIFMFCLLIVAYILLMNRLDKKHDLED